MHKTIENRYGGYNFLILSIANFNEGVVYLGSFLEYSKPNPDIIKKYATAGPGFETISHIHPIKDRKSKWHSTMQISMIKRMLSRHFILFIIVSKTQVHGMLVISEEVWIIY